MGYNVGMKIIIDIPEEAYKQIMEFGFLENTHGKICYKAIKNGTVLPKHGRLIDADEVLKDIDDLRKSPWYNDKRGNGFEYLIHEAVDMVQDLCILDAPTILEADDETKAQ